MCAQFDKKVSLDAKTVAAIIHEQYICECGMMMYCNADSTFTCKSDWCKHYKIKYLPRTVILKEAPK